MKYWIICAALLVVGCADQQLERTPPPPPPAEIIDMGDAATNRFAIKVYGKFWGGYRDNVRQVFVVTDRNTGVEYLAITGCGTTELISETYRSGKHQHTRTVEE